MSESESFKSFKNHIELLLLTKSKEQNINSLFSFFLYYSRSVNLRKQILTSSSLTLHLL